MKTCNSCGREKPEPDFYKDSHLPGGLRHRRKQCEMLARATPEQRQKQREATLRWRKANPEKLRLSHLNSQLKHNYGITLDQREEMRRSQEGKCGICGEKTELHVDHCHKTGVVRELLCTHCNKGLAGFKDTVSNLQSAIRYLQKHFRG